MIFVTGATGKQGGSVVKNLLKSGFKVRALTRNPDSSQAKGLQSKGVDIVKGDWIDAGTFESLLKATNLVAETGANKIPGRGAPPRNSKNSE